MSDYERPDVIPVSITRLVEQAVSGEIDIPEFQRDFIWTKDQVKELFDSLVNGYPVGVFLIWDLTNYTSGKHVYEGKSKQWMVDGQQRLVSFGILSLKKPYWMDTSDWNKLISRYKVKVNILTLQVSLESSAIAKNPEWLYAHEILAVTDVKEAAERLSASLNRPELFTKVYDNLKHAKDALTRQIPIVKISTSPEHIATIFDRINSAGTRVRLADVTLAYIAAYNKGWITSNFMKYMEALDDEGFQFPPTLMIRALTAVGENKATLREVGEDFLRNKDLVLDTAFIRLKNSTNKLVQDFRDKGLLSSELIYAKNTVIPLMYLHSKFENQWRVDSAFHYFLLALRNGRYSGSAETTLQEDINKVNKAATFQQAVADLHSDIERATISEDSIANTVHYQGEGRFLKLVLYLIAYRNQACDWFSRTRLGYLPNNEINRDFSIEEHHFFPRGLLRSVGVERERRESLANVTFINPGTNKRLRDEPDIYLRRLGIDETELRIELGKQLIPTNDRDLWKLSNYDRFIQERSRLLAKGIGDFLKELYPAFYERRENQTGS